MLLFILFSKVFPIISIWEVDQTKWPRPAKLGDVHHAGQAVTA
jgi:hypothetical protein